MGKPEQSITQFPYGSVRIGDDRFLMHIPTQRKMFPIPLPRSVVEHVSLRLNTLNKHRAYLELTNMTQPPAMRTLVKNETTTCWRLGLVSTEKYHAILAECEA